MTVSDLGEWIYIYGFAIIIITCVVLFVLISIYGLIKWILEVREIKKYQEKILKEKRMRENNQ